LKYENVSCCANTGFDGYYTIAEFMLRHVPTIKAVVLYISLNNAPRDPETVISNVVGGEDRLRSAFGPLSGLTSPATLALRHDVLERVYNLGSTFKQSALVPFEDLQPEFAHSIQETRGWRPEGDIHRLPEQQRQKMTELCGPDNRRVMGGHLPHDYTRDIFGIRHTYTDIELRRLAALTAQYNAKLIFIAQPYPCSEIVGGFISSLIADLEAVRKEYPNLIVPDPQLFEAWPGRFFSSDDHLKTGHEDAASRRAGRLIAKALGIAYVEPEQSTPPPPPKPVLATTQFDGSPWIVRGVTLRPLSTKEGLVVTETASFGPHLLEGRLPSLYTGTYTASFTLKTDAQRQVIFQFQSLQWPGDSGHFECSASLGEVQRTLSVVDSSIERLANGAIRCSGTFKITRPGSVITIGLSPSHDTNPYLGDGSSSATLYEFQLSSVAD
jgi:hypothetical protein